MPTFNAPARARRFNLHLPLRYRALGEKRWHSGVTDNVSCSGVLLRGRRVLPPSAPVQILLSVPRQLAGEAQVKVLCSGQVARVVPRRFPLFSATLGVRVIDYELVEAPAGVPPGRVAPSIPWLVEIAHELNNMLAVVTGCSEILLSDCTDPKVLQQAENIQKAAQRSAQLVQQMLARGRYEAVRSNPQANGKN